MEKLIDAVIAQIHDDINSKDLTAIVELLDYVPEKILKGYLSDERQIELNLF